jgi:hypothetical protein
VYEKTSHPTGMPLIPLYSSGLQVKILFTINVPVEATPLTQLEVYAVVGAVVNVASI